VYEKIVQLKIVAEDGKKRETDMADTELMPCLIRMNWSYGKTLNG